MLIKNKDFLKFIYCEKATEFEAIFHFVCGLLTISELYIYFFLIMAS